MPARDFSGIGWEIQSLCRHDPRCWLESSPICNLTCSVLMFSRASSCTAWRASQAHSLALALPHFPVDYHEFPWHPCLTVNGTKRSARLQTPQEQVSYRHPASPERRDPARERADIPPGGARSRAYPAMGRGRRIGQWQQPDPPLSFRATGKGTAGQWFGGSEASSTRRWTGRGGSPSRPTSAASSKPAIPPGPKANPPNS